MKLRSVKIEKTLTPKWEGNKDLPISEQVKIYFTRIPGTSEESNYKENKFSQNGGISIQYNDQMMVAAFVSKIENLEIEVGNDIKKISTGVDLSEANNPLLKDLFNEIRDHLFPLNEDISTGESIA